MFNTEDEAIEYADEIKPIGWMSFAMPFNTTLNESDNTYKAKRLKEGLGSLGKGFGQGLFDKDSVLTSKNEDDKKSMWVAKTYNYDDTWDEYYIDENGKAVKYIDDAKAFDNEKDAEEWAAENRFYNWGACAEKLSESKKRLKETVDSTSAAFNLTKLKGYLRFETRWEYDEDFIEDAMLVDKVHEPPRFTVKWIGPKGKKHPNTYCVRTRRDRGESWDWETHYFLKASDAAEMINLEVGTWEHNNMSWKFESKEQLFNVLLESIDDFPKNTRSKTT